MANRYWVGGGGTWSLSSTANWSATSNGASGASAPTSADDVYFDVNSNVGITNWTVTLGAAAACANLNIIGIDAQLTFNLGTLYANTLTIYNNINYSNVNVATTTSVFYTSVSPNWAATTTLYFTTTNFIKLGMTASSVAYSIGTATSVNRILGSANIGSLAIISTVTSARLPFAATNQGGVPVSPQFASTSLAFTPQYLSLFPALPYRDIETMGSTPLVVSTVSISKSALGAANIGEVPVITTVTSARLPFAATNQGEVPVSPQFASTSLAFTPKYLSLFPATPYRDIEKFGLNSSNTIAPIPYQFWG